VAAAVALAAVGLAVAAAFSALLDVDRIEVRGAERTPVEAVLAAAGIAPGDPLVTVDAGRARDRIGALPWVGAVEVRRSVTGTVTLRITERTPVATLPAAGGGWVLVDADGRQLEPAPPPGPGTVAVRGVEASGRPGEPVPAMAQSVLSVLAVLTPPVRPAVAGVAVEGRELVLELAGGGLVRLGEPSGLEAKLVALETMLSRVDLRCLAVLDLSVPSAPALTRALPPGGDAGDAVADLSKCP
jgi:cell division protein FtsQ